MATIRAHPGTRVATDYRLRAISWSTSVLMRPHTDCDPMPCAHTSLYPRSIRFGRISSLAACTTPIMTVGLTIAYSASRTNTRIAPDNPGTALAAALALAFDSKSKTNYSPPKRSMRYSLRNASFNASAMPCRTTSSPACPCSSLTPLKRYGPHQGSACRGPSIQILHDPRQFPSYQ